MIANEKCLLDMDQANKLRKMARIKLEEFILQCEKDLSSKQTVRTQIEIMREKLASELEWLGCNQHREADVFEGKLDELKTLFDEILVEEKNEKARVHLKEFILNLEKELSNSILLKSKIKTMKRYYEKDLEWLENNSTADAMAVEKRLKSLQHRFDDLVQQQKQQKELIALQLAENISTVEQQLTDTPKLPKSEIEILLINCEKTSEWLKCEYNDFAISLFEKRLQNCKTRFNEILTHQKDERSKAAQKLKLQKYIQSFEEQLSSELTKDQIVDAKKKLDWLYSNCDCDAGVFEERFDDLKTHIEELKNCKKPGVVTKLVNYFNQL
jgi:hypothetical protein